MTSQIFILLLTLALPNGGVSINSVETEGENSCHLAAKTWAANLPGRTLDRTSAICMSKTNPSDNPIVHQIYPDPDAK